jgi:hypothetical protein
MKEASSNTSNAFQLAALQSITQICRALRNFEYLIKDSVDDSRVDTSSLWAMTYLNVKVRGSSAERRLFKTGTDVPH